MALSPRMNTPHQSSPNRTGPVSTRGSMPGRTLTSLIEPPSFSLSTASAHRAGVCETAGGAGVARCAAGLWHDYPAGGRTFARMFGRCVVGGFDSQELRYTHGRFDRLP